MKKILLSLVACVASYALYGVDVQSSIVKLSGDDYTARKAGRTELKQAFADVTAPGGQVNDRAAIEQAVISALQSGKLSLSEKLYLFRVLGLYGTNASADAVYSFLGDKEKEIRDSARRALVLIPGDKALGYLLSGMKKGADAERASYVDALATRGDPSVAMDIATYLKSDDSALVRNAAVALGKLGNEEALPALLEIYPSAAADVKPAVEAALLDVGVDSQTAYMLAGIGSSAAIRAGAFEQLIDVDLANATVVLKSVIGQPEFVGRSLFFKAALASSSTDLQQLVVEHLPKAEEAAKAIIVTAIGENDLKQFEPEVLALISHESWLLRMDVIHTLGNVGGAASFEALLKAFLAEPKNQTIGNAVARVQAPEGDKSALSQVRDGTDLSARTASMKVLELRNVKGASELLNEIVKDSQDVKLREAALKTLENIGTIETIEICLDLILKGDPQTSAIQRSLKRLSLNFGAPEAQWNTAYSPALESAPSVASCEAVVLILDAVQSDGALQYLEPHVLNAESKLHPASLRTLQRFSNVKSGDVWIKVAASAADVSTAQKAIVKLLKVDNRHTAEACVQLAVKAVQEGPTTDFKEAILSIYKKPSRYQKRYIKGNFKTIQDDVDVGATVKQVMSGV